MARGFADSFDNAAPGNWPEGRNGIYL